MPNAVKLNYFVIYAVVFSAAFLGSLMVGQNMGWYATIKLPLFTPPGSVIGWAWTVIYILTSVAFIAVWNRFSRGRRFDWLLAVFLLNLFLNAAWTWLFFWQHWLGWAAIESVFLALSVLFLIVLITPVSRLIALLLYPYFFWSTFASFLSFNVWYLNVPL